MKVRVSSEARTYIAREAGYLKARSAAGAASFKQIVAWARRLVGEHPEIGFPDAEVPIIGARRIIIGDYLFDYDILDGVVWIQNVRHARNTPIITIEEEDDYEVPPPSAESGFGKK